MGPEKRRFLVARKRAADYRPYKYNRCRNTKSSKKSRFLLDLARTRFPEAAAEYLAPAGAFIASSHRPPLLKKIFVIVNVN
jgi:hypothetical protein